MSWEEEIINKKGLKDNKGSIYINMKVVKCKVKRIRFIGTGEDIWDHYKEYMKPVDITFNLELSFHIELKEVHEKI